MVKSCFCANKSKICANKSSLPIGVSLLLKNSFIIISRISNRPRSQQHCVYFSQHVGQVKIGCIGIKSYELISGLFQVIFSDLLLKWVSVFMPVLVALHNQFVVNKMQNANFKILLI